MLVVVVLMSPLLLVVVVVTSFRLYNVTVGALTPKFVPSIVMLVLPLVATVGGTMAVTVGGL